MLKAGLVNLVSSGFNGFWLRLFTQVCLRT